MTLLKCAILMKAQKCYYSSERLIYSIHHNLYESYYPVYVPSHANTFLFHRQEQKKNINKIAALCLVLQNFFFSF